MQNFRDLKVWQRSHDLTLKIYKATALFPKEELYGLTSQIRRASASIPANIAEGCGRHTDAEFARFLQIAMGSASELEYHIFLSYELSFLTAPQYEDLTNHLSTTKKMLNSLIQKLRANS